MSQFLERYIFLFEQLQDNDLDDQIRNKYENEIDELYYELDENDLEYIAEKELEM